MKKLLIGAALCALFAAPAFAGDPAQVSGPVQLTLSQMDSVTAGRSRGGRIVDGVDICVGCANVNTTTQLAAAKAYGGFVKFSKFSGNADAYADNYNSTYQSIN
jgi:hypothetical protein